MLMLQQHAATNKQWINCILIRIIIENNFLTINSSFIEIFLEKWFFHDLQHTLENAAANCSNK